MADVVLPDVVTTATPLPPPAQPIVANPAAPYAVRKIDLMFNLGTGPYGSSTPTQLTITGLRVFAQIEAIVAPHAGAQLVMRVYGMTLDHMNQLSRAGLLFRGAFNAVLVSAGDDISGMTTVANLLIQEAYPDLNGAADERHFYIYAAGPGGVIQLKPISTSSYPSSAPASQVLQRLCQQIGYTLQNQGVNVVLNRPYFYGTAYQQILACVRAADCLAHFDSVNMILRVWPKNGTATSSSEGSVTISPASGMIGYPAFQQNQIIVRTIFGPQSASLSPGKKVTVQSQLQAANNAMINLSLVAHTLESQQPGGPWETTLVGVPPVVGPPPA